MSKLKVTTLATADDLYSVPAETLARGACRAWVNFDGTTTPPTIRESFNVSSVVRNGTGDYTVSFNSAMPDTDYSIIGNVAIAAATVQSGLHILSQLSTSFTVQTTSVNASAFILDNFGSIYVTVFR